MFNRQDDVSNLKLIDFGLSKELGSVTYGKSLFSGTPFYLAPEAISKNASPASDIWSLGIIMYICLAGKLPFSGENTKHIINEITNKDLKIEDDANLEHVSDEAKNLLAKML